MVSHNLRVVVHEQISFGLVSIKVSHPNFSRLLIASLPRKQDLLVQNDECVQVDITKSDRPENIVLVLRADAVTAAAILARKNNRITNDFIPYRWCC